MSNSPSNLTGSKIALVTTIITCIVGVLAFLVGLKRDADQALDKQKEFQQKEADLFLKQGDVQRAKDSAKADFLQKNLTLLTSGAPGALRQVEALIDASFTAPGDALELKTKARTIHDIAAESVNPNTDKAQSDYKSLGYKYAKAGHFSEAVLSFSTAVSLAPKDIRTWNALAYAQLQQGDANSAFTSISRAIELGPVEENLSGIIAINATKILCAQGRNDHALTYLKVAIGINARLLPTAKGDGELLRLCRFQFG